LRTAALYDIHGNLPALEAVLHEAVLCGADKIVIGGDVVTGPMPRKCLDRLLEISIPIHFIKGNCETAVLAQMNNKPIGNLPKSVLEEISWTANQLQTAHEAFLAKWHKTITLEIEGLGEVLFCHATPRDENEIFTLLTPEDHLLPVFEEVNEAVVVCGHTHMQFDRIIGKVRVVNAGSVGMPFGKTGADWLLLGPGVQLRHTSYNLKEAAERIGAAKYPQALEFAEKYVLNSPSEKEMLEAYSKVEIGASKK